MTFPTVADFSDLRVDDLIFATLPYGSDFIPRHPFVLVESGVWWMRCTEIPTDLNGFPQGTTFALARGVGVVR